MNAPPFPTNPSVGDFFGNWVWNGVRWVCSPAAGVRVVIQTFTASGPYMPSQGLVTSVVETIGGGGGGGAALTTANTQLYGGGGGGSGGYSRIALAAALVAGGVQVTIGAGGAGGNPGDGAAGSATTFGALCVANGGLGGHHNDGTTGFGQAGAGAPPGTGDVAFPGGWGQNGAFAIFTAQTFMGPQGSIGGSTMAGGAGVPDAGVTGALSGIPGVANTGAGGSGGVVNQNTGPAQGGAGGSGICIVTEYCWADTAPDDDCLNPPVNVNARVAVTHVPWTGPGPCPPGWGQVEYEGE